MVQVLEFCMNSFINCEVHRIRKGTAAILWSVCDFIINKQVTDQCKNDFRPMASVPSCSG